MPRLDNNYKIIRLCKDLKLLKKKDPVTSIREYCVEKVEKIIEVVGSINNLEGLLYIIASSVGIIFEEVHSDTDIVRISEKYLHEGELKFADLKDEFTSETDAILIERTKAKEWEKKFIAIIDCRGLKKYRAYFSKWHEVAHVLTLPPQRSFVFLHRTATKKKAPEEKLMDIIASDFAFYSPLFLPELNAKLKEYQRLSFKLIDELRAEVCPKASRYATALAAVSKAKMPAVFLVAQFGFKKEEERLLESSQLSLIEREPIVEKLRATDVHINSAAKEQGFFIHKNMEVPPNSIISDIYFVKLSEKNSSAIENLNWWKHSRGQLPNFEIEVEALKSGERVLSLIRPV